MLDFGELAKKIVSKFNQAGGYTDVDSDEMLELSVEEYLKEEYKKEIGIASIRVQMREQEKGFVSKDVYNDALKRAEQNIANRARYIAAVTEDELY